MTKGLLIITLFLFTCTDLCSRTDTLSKKTHFGFGLNPVVFINYYYYQNSIKDILTPGLNPEFIVNYRRHYFAIGALTGNSYPILPFTNYYCGYDFRLSPDKWKIDIVANSKFAFMHYKDKYLSSITTVWESYSVLLGGTIQKRFKKITLGLSYLYEWGNFKLTQTDNKDAHVIYKIDKTGPMRTGYLIFKVNYYFGRRPSHNSK